MFSFWECEKENTLKTNEEHGNQSNDTIEQTVGYGFVDLGLSVVWAEHNLGTSTPAGYGQYFAWGETRSDNSYYWPDYKFYNESDTSITKYYYKNFEWWGNGVIDNKCILEPEDDAAQVLWGKGWRMPTRTELEELVKYCTWTVVTKNGVEGYEVTSNITGFTDQSIFLPSAGYMINTLDRSRSVYWSNTLRTSSPEEAYVLEFSTLDKWAQVSIYYRHYGGTIRPVRPVEVTSITLDETDITLELDSTFQLNAMVKSEDVNRIFTIEWSSSNENVARVDQNGLVKALSVGTASITASCLGKNVSCKITINAEPYEYVDLGLSVKWATCNVGASQPEEYGYYYQWGDIEQSDHYYWDEYKYCLYDVWWPFNDDFLTKYCNDSKYGKRKYKDDITVLEPEDDVAHARWGADWRMPTDAEFEELIDNCTWTWTEENGVGGYRITSNITGYTDRSVFLPAAGAYESDYRNDQYGRYWSSSLYLSIPKNAYGLYFNGSDHGMGNWYRCDGATVRPVCPSEEWSGITSIKIDNGESLSLSVKEHYGMKASAKRGDSDYNYHTIWSSDNESVATVNSYGVVTALSVGEAKIIATCLGKTAECIVTVVPESISGIEAVDLGLTVCWASFNVGATHPESYGDYYAWGETESKSCYYDNTYKYYNGTDLEKGVLTKYCIDSKQGYEGFTDGKTMLDAEDDVAHVKWGGDWRMPTSDEQQELLNYCTWTWTTLNGVDGCLVTSNKPGYTDRSIFLPAAGECFDTRYERVGRSGLYWSKNLYTASTAWNNYYNPNHLMFFTSDMSLFSMVGYSYDHIHGFTVRPVCPSPAWESATLQFDTKDNLSLVPDEVYSLSASIKNTHITVDDPFYWSSDNEEVAIVNEYGVVTALSVGKAVIKVTCLNKVAECVINVTAEPDYEIEAIDLGLSVKWGSCNVNASSPESYGGYYSWGETETKTSYLWNTYLYYVSGDCDLEICLSKYVTQSSYGTVDDKTVLEPDDDVAHVKLGSNWRMPTAQEMQEFLYDCTWSWTTQNGVIGYRVTSNKPELSDNSVFIPAAGYKYDSDYCNTGYVGQYWTSKLSNNYPDNAAIGQFASNYKWYNDNHSRYFGLPIRPVCPKE